ncbi:MAG: LD-carboxypeptidase [Candidatus Pacearchaeota archaeon]
MDLIKPSKLKKFDCIAIISPSSGLAGRYPHRINRAVDFFKSQGYKVKEFPSTRKDNGWESASAEERAKDIMAAFLDKEVKAIITSIGGTVALQTLKYLDYKKIKSNPKIFCGYSDISILHYAFYTQCSLISFYGPCAMTQFGEYPQPQEYTIEYFNKAVKKGKIGIVRPSKKWTEEIPDWSKKEDLKRARKLKKNKGFEWLREGKAKGQILGGCLSSIIHLAGTKYWPDYKNRILFLEIPEGQKFDHGEPLPYVDFYLEQLEVLGVYKQIKGLIFGRPYRYSDNETFMLKKKLIERTKDYNFPILFNVDIGHTDPQITIPLGIQVEINSEKNIFKFLEEGVS